MTGLAKLQRIQRLTPLSTVLATIEKIAAPAAARDIDLKNGTGRVLAQPVIAPRPTPRNATALQDGWAVRADELADASAYAPVQFAVMPRWINAGETLPSGTDAIVPFEAIELDGNSAQAVAQAVAGQGVLHIGDDAFEGLALRKEGQRVRDLDIVLGAKLGVTRISAREPRIALVWSGRSLKQEDLSFFAGRISSAGGSVETHNDFEAALVNPSADAVIAVGGTGIGRNDDAVMTLARCGELIHHGIAISPGETAAIGTAKQKPVLILPGRLDAALSAWLLLGRALLARLSGSQEQAALVSAPLTRKISSAIGLSEVVLLKRAKGGLEPMASGFHSIAALAQADGWMLVPPESEGFAVGTGVEMAPLL